jgi:hypothetical protein
VTRGRFLAGLSAAYAAVTVLIVLSINGYFSVGWDAQIFAGVGRAVIDNNPVFDLYQKTRQAWGDWGFPYPPLYALLLAPFMGLVSIAPALPDWLIVRALPVIFDLALAVLLYLLVLRRSRREHVARLAAALWLFNPLTLYQTAIQAHQESSWLVCVVAAYALLDRPAPATERQPGIRAWLGANGALPALLMACAVTLKQSAVLFYIPYVVFIFLDRERRWTRLAVAGGLFALVFGGLSLPFHLHSPDFFYLVYVDVSNMPLQTQSAVVWLLGLKQFLIDQTRSTFFLLKYQTLITMGLALVVSFLTLRRDRNLVRTGLLIALLFFLTSKKVMGYHHVLLVPFLVLYALPDRRFDLIAVSLLAASWIILSPYFAPWARPEHLPLYAAIGTPNTLLWLYLFIHVWRRADAIRIGSLNLTERLRDGGAAMAAITLITLGMILSCSVQPLVGLDEWAIHRLGLAGGAFYLGLIGALLLGVIAASLIATEAVGWRLFWITTKRGAAHVVLAVLLIPVYFAAFALTQESTKIVETLLGASVP